MLAGLLSGLSLSGRRVVIGLAVITTLALIVTRFWVLSSSHAAAFANAEGATQDWALSVEDYAKRTLAVGDLVIDQVAAEVRRAGGIAAIRDSRIFHDRLQDLSQRSLSGGILIVDASGRPAAFTGSFPAPNANLSDRSWYRAHMQEGAMRFVGEAIHSRLTDEVLFTLTRPYIGPGGAFEGVIQASMRTDFFQKATLSAALGSQAAISLWKSTGELMARTNITPAIARTGLTNPLLVSRAAVATAGTYRSRSVVDGADRLSSYRVVEGWPVIAAASVPVASILAPWWREVATSVLLLLSALVVIAMLAALGLRSVSREEAATLRLAATNADLTRALEKKDLLIREVHHRVKNNLQIVASFLRLRFRKVADPEVHRLMADVELRMRALAMLHETLYGQDVDDTFPADRYLAGVVDDARRALQLETRNISLSFSGESLEITLDQAIPLGLLVSELLTNAARHGFAGRPSGAIEVTLRHDADAGALLRVADDGDGFGGPLPGAASLGMQLVKAFSAQLGGRFSFRDEGGVVFELHFPIQAGPASA